jgi:hypothetical protein
VSPHAVRRRDHISWRTPRECENPAGALRLIGLVWKPTIISNRNSLVATSFLTGLSYHFVLLHSGSPMPRAARQPARLVLWGWANQARSALLRLLASSRTTALLQSSRKLLSFKDFLLNVQGRGLDKRAFRRYMALHRATSRCDSSAEISKGSVPGLLMMGREG